MRCGTQYEGPVWQKFRRRDVTDTGLSQPIETVKKSRHVAVVSMCGQIKACWILDHSRWDRHKRYDTMYLPSTKGLMIL